MQTTCTGCQARYSIADDKVRGRVVRIRCRKCGAAILIRGDKGAVEERAEVGGGTSSSGAEQTPGARVEEQGGADAKTKVYDYSAHQNRGERSKEWSLFDNDGGLFAPSDPTAEDSASIWGGAQESANSGDDRSRESRKVAHGPDLFGSTPPAGSSGGPRVAPGTERLIGTRNENSVLFDLSRLEALTSSSSGAVSSDGERGRNSANLGGVGSRGQSSCMIDIRALAADVSQPENDEGADELFDASFAREPVLKARTGGRVSFQLVGIIGVIVVLFSATVIAAALVFVGEKPQRDSGDEAKIAELTAALEKVTARLQKADTAEASDLQRQLQMLEAGFKGRESNGTDHAAEVQVDAVDAKGSTQANGPRRKGEKKRRKAAAKETGAVGAKDDQATTDLDELLAGAVSSPKPATSAKSPATVQKSAQDQHLFESLTKAQVKKALRSVVPRVARCSGGEHGTVKLKIVIAGATGRVKSARAVGGYAGTPIGLCAERAVKSASFPKFRKSSLSVVYPFKI